MNDIGKKRFKALEICGVFFIFICGTLLHFLYEFTDGSVVGILFGSVNESVWEHVKIFALPYVAWGIIELCFSIPYFRQFVVAKVFGVYLQSGLIIVLFYCYITFIGQHILWLDILEAIVCICVSQFFSYKMTTNDKDLRYLFPFALGLLFLFGAMYFCFSVVPPHIELFKDPLTDIYGIVPKNIDVGAYFMNNIEV